MTVEELQAALDEVVLMHKELSEKEANLRNGAGDMLIQAGVNVPQMSELRGMLMFCTALKKTAEQRLVSLRDQKEKAVAEREAAAFKKEMAADAAMMLQSKPKEGKRDNSDSA